MHLTGMVDDEHDCLEASVGLEWFALQTSTHAWRVFCHGRYSLCYVSSVDQGNRCLPVGVSTGIQAARARGSELLVWTLRCLWNHRVELASPSPACALGSH